MKFSHYIRKNSSQFAALAGAAALLGLSSCEEKAPGSEPAADVQEEVQAPPPAEASEPAASADTPVSTDNTENLEKARTALFNHAVFTLGAKISSPDTFPELNSIAKDMLEMMQAYYAELQKGELTKERVQLAVQIAASTRDLGAFGKAMQEYENAIKEIEAMPEDFRKSTEGQRLLSACHNGMGVCQLSQNKASEALTCYEKAIELDEAIFNAVAPKDFENISTNSDVPPALSQATTDLLDSYRCLGDCHRVLGATEEAMNTYGKGIEIAQKLKRLSSDMSISYVKLLTSTGNLLNALNMPGEAHNAWVHAADICQKVNASSPRLDVKAETKRCFDALRPAIQAVGSKLQQIQQEKEKKLEEERRAAEQAAKENEAAAKAAEERLAMEQKAAEEQARQAEAAAKKATAPKTANNQRKKRK